MFLASACGLVLEIVAGRLLAPTIGVSLYTWTSIIGVVLAGISVGSFAGGIVADRYPSPTTLGLLLVAGGISSLSVLPLVDVASDSFAFLPVLPRIVFVTASLFFIPSLILGMTTPVVIKMHLRDLADTGKVVGRIYAFSAAGSIFGTFITGFVLIQWVGSRHTLILVAVTLVVLALVFGNLRREKFLSLGSLLILLGLGATGFATGALDSGCTRESNYYCIRVSDKVIEGDRPVKVLHLDKLLHSYTSVEDPTYLNYGYEKVLSEIAAFVASSEPSLNVLFIGGGGYTLPRYMEEVFPGSTLEVIEIDPEVTRVAYDYLGLAPDSRIKTYNEDARMVLPELQDGQYDLVIGDAFHDISVPYHLTTQEFNEQVKDLLTNDGIYAVNVIDKLHSGKFLRAYVDTLQRTFDYVYLFRAIQSWDSDRRDTFVVVGSPEPLSSTDLYSAAIESGIDNPVGNSMPQTEFDSWLASKNNVHLVDDHAPVDYLLASVFFARARVSDAEKFFNRGVSLQNEGRPEEAISEYSEAINLDPGFPLAYHNRGQNFAELDQFERAIEDFDQATRLEPQAALVYFSRALAYSRLDEHNRSIEDFDEVIRLDANFAMAYRHRGLAYFDLGQTQRSIQDFDQAIFLEPENEFSYFNRATSYHSLGQFQLAIEDFDEAIRLNANAAEFHLDRATAYFFLEQLQQALQGYTEAIRLDSEIALAYANRAQMNALLGMDTEAQQDINRAVELGSDRGELEGIVEEIKNLR